MLFIQAIKDGANIINLDEYKSIRTHWIALYVNAENATYFDSFGVDFVLKWIRKFIGNKNIVTNTYRIQAYDWIMRGCLKDDKIILNHFRKKIKKNIGEKNLLRWV